MKVSKCRVCNKLFPIRSNKEFCSTICRSAAWRAGIKAKTAECFYCTMPADTMDHTPPKSVRPYLLSQGWTESHFYEVPACKECNSLLGAREPWTPADRRKRIHALLRHRYRKYLSMPEWTEADLAALEPFLRAEVRRGLAVKEMTLVRTIVESNG